MLRLLMEQFNGRVVLFLDNLESLQDQQALTMHDARVAAWMDVACKTQGLLLLVTSRWLIPGWDGEHLPLTRANYGDFLLMAQGFRLPAAILERRGELRHVYKALGGNCRGLEFFATAVRGMKDEDEKNTFLDALARTKTDLHANMAIEAIYKRLPEDAQRLLQHLPAYHEPVPTEGLIKLGLDLPEPEALLERLLAVSLLEASSEPYWAAIQYQCAPMVADWLGEQGLIQDDPQWLNAAADYHRYLFNHERKTLQQAITTHHALRRAKRDNEADRMALDSIVGTLTMAGLYVTLLTEWLPGICQSEDFQTRAEALGQTGKINFHLGDYETALSYLKQSLAIMQQIGDKAGLCATLFNMGHIYLQHEQTQEAVNAWVNVYLIAKQINLAHILQALARLAPKLGGKEGLEDWERLAQGMQGGKCGK